MELDPQLQDDNASFASSHSLPNSDDVDDLHLGAEANTFSPNLDKVKGENSTISSFLIIRRGHSIDEEDSFFTFSTISSIPDLIDAREGDPEDLLFQLGFTHLDTKSHSSILSRFNGSLDERTDASYSPDHQRQDFSYDARDGIVKARQWLNTQQNDNDCVLFPNFSKDLAQSYKASPSGAGRKLVAQKKRLKWSKSRQSSFEHLLPNLQEESAVEVQESENDVLKDEPSIQPIRESSTEQEPIHPEVKDILHALADPSLKHLSASKCSNLINTKVDSFELEEVVSNDGATVNGRPPPDTMPIRNSANLKEETHDEDQRHWDNCNPSSSVGSVDSSSGFDDGPDDIIKSSAEQSPTTSTLQSERDKQRAADSSRDESNDLQVVNTDSSEFNDDSVCSCALEICASCHDRNDSGDFIEWKAHSQGYNTLLEEASSMLHTKECACRWRDSQRSAMSLSAAQSMQDLSGKEKLHNSKLSSKSFSNLNSNFNNSVDNSLSPKRQERLRRTRSLFFSTPALSSAIFPRNRAADCEFFNVNQHKVTSDSSLMTSIADVAYLSYRRYFTENHKLSKSNQSFAKSNIQKTNSAQNSTPLSQ